MLAGPDPSPSFIPRAPTSIFTCGAAVDRPPLSASNPAPNSPRPAEPGWPKRRMTPAITAPRRSTPALHRATLRPTWATDGYPACPPRPRPAQPPPASVPAMTQAASVFSYAADSVHRSDRGLISGGPSAFKRLTASGRPPIAVQGFSHNLPAQPPLPSPGQRRGERDTAAHRGRSSREGGPE